MPNRYIASQVAQGVTKHLLSGKLGQVPCPISGRVLMSSPMSVGSKYGDCIYAYGYYYLLHRTSKTKSVVYVFDADRKEVGYMESPDTVVYDD